MLYSLVLLMAGVFGKCHTELFSCSVLTFANVIYWPYKWIGFQFATILFASFATIGSKSIDMVKGQIYQAYGFGVLIRKKLPKAFTGSGPR